MHSRGGGWCAHQRYWAVSSYAASHAASPTVPAALGRCPACYPRFKGLGQSPAILSRRWARLSDKRGLRYDAACCGARTTGGAAWQLLYCGVHPVAHLPLILGVLRRLHVATIIDDLIPPHPSQLLSCGHGVEELLLAILDGHHALYKVGRRVQGAWNAPCTPVGPTIPLSQ